MLIHENRLDRAAAHDATPAALVPSREPLEFHRRLPGYAPTPLIDAPTLARWLDVGQVLVKDESLRFGLPAFKVLGASWAIYRVVRDRLGLPIRPWHSLHDLRQQLRPLGHMRVVTATDGNHGRAVARVASWLGWQALVFVPRNTAPARVEAIEAEGAEVRAIDGLYDDAVALAAAQADARTLVIADTAETENDPVAGWVIEGYQTPFWEIDDAMSAGRRNAPDLVVVQVGVGALAAAAIRHYLSAERTGQPRPRLVAVEPKRSACVLASMQAGHRVSLAGGQDSIMAGLNCGTPSAVAWPWLLRGLNLCVAVEDEPVPVAMCQLAEVGIVAGETGAAGLAGAHELLSGAQAAHARDMLAIDRSSAVLLLCTEGATDPVSYQRSVGGHTP